MMKTTVIDETEMSPELDQSIRDGLCVCFSPDVEVFSKTRTWHGSAPAWSVVMEMDGKVVAHVGIVDRKIRVGDRFLRVAGIQNVFVLPEERGKGLCDAVMDTAMVEAAKRRFDAGLLFCVPELEKVYARVGWKLMPKEDVVRIDDNGAEQKLPAKNIAMFFPLKVKKFPPGTIHLRGNDW